MVRGMVERLAQRLKQDGSDVDGWLRLVRAYTVLGEKDRAREWIDRALLLDPDNLSMRYNLACSLALELGDPEGALDALQPYFERVRSKTHIRHLEADPDFNSIRAHPRFRKMLVAAKERLGMLAPAK